MSPCPFRGEDAWAAWWVNHISCTHLPLPPAYVNHRLSFHWIFRVIIMDPQMPFRTLSVHECVCVCLHSEWELKNLNMPVRICVYMNVTCFRKRIQHHLVGGKALSHLNLLYMCQTVVQALKNTKLTCASTLVHFYGMSWNCFRGAASYRYEYKKWIKSNLSESDSR